MHQSTLVIASASYDQTIRLCDFLSPHTSAVQIVHSEAQVGVFLFFI